MLAGISRMPRTLPILLEVSKLVYKSASEYRKVSKIVLGVLKRHIIFVCYLSFFIFHDF